MYDKSPIPIENSDPELANQFLDIINGRLKARIISNKVYKINLGKLVEVGAEVNRNDPCPCGSGKKYKKCCIA